MDNPTEKEIKKIKSLIDDSIENDEYEDAFYLFIKFVGKMDNNNRDYFFRIYAELLDIKNI
jgi:hypothetical protein